MKKIKILSSLLLTIIVFNSCVKKDPLARIAQVLLVPLSPNSGAINFSINGEIKATTVNYSTTIGTIRYTLPYYTIEPKNASTVSYNEQSTNVSVASVTGDIVDDGVYSTFLIDSVNKRKAIMVSDDLNDVSNPSNIKIRFFNFSPNAPAVNVFLVGGSTTTPVWGNRPFETQATATAKQGFIEMPAGSYAFEVRDASTNALLITIATQAYLPERIYTIAARGFVGNATSQGISGWVYPNLP